MLLIFIPVLTAVFCYLCYAYITFNQKWKYLASTFGTPKGCNWLLGHLAVHPGPNEEGLQWFMDAAEQHPFMFAVRYGFRAGVNAVDPEAVKIILKSSEPKDMTFYGFLFPWLGDGLLLSSGGKWQRNRRLLTPAFHFDILKPYVRIYNEAADKLCEELLDSARDESSVEFSDPITRATLDIILRCAFSVTEDAIQKQRKDSVPRYGATLETLKDIVTVRTFRAWEHPDWLYNLLPSGRRFHRCCDYLHDVSQNIISKRRKDLEANPDLLQHKKRRDFLDILLTARDDSGTGLSHADIQAEVDTFLFEGHDTTASALTWIMKEIAFNPDHQRRCREEVDDLLQGREDDDINWSDLQQLPYTTLCIKEALRLNTPVPFMSRNITKDLDFGGKIVPKGTNVDILLATIQRNKRVWGADADEFRPERMGGAENEARDPFAFCPFSAGPRNCIGQNFAMNEIKVTVGKILRRFELTRDPERTPRRLLEMVVKPENGLYLKLTPRAH